MVTSIRAIHKASQGVTKPGLVHPEVGLASVNLLYTLNYGQAQVIQGLTCP